MERLLHNTRVCGRHRRWALGVQYSAIRFAILALLLASCSSGGDGRDEPFVAAEGGVRRLLAPQYLNSVRYFFGSAAAEAAESLLPEDFVADGFLGVGAGRIPPSVLAATEYSQAADAVAEAVACEVREQRSASRLAQFVPCVGAPEPEVACYLELSETLLPLVLRRPATEDEIAQTRGLAIQGSQLGSLDFYRGLRYAVLSMLQSPSFLYIVEVGEPDSDEPERRRLDPYELASRMSFFLTDTTPDEELMAVARDGTLAQPSVRRAQATRLVETPAARDTMQRRFSEFLAVDQLSEATKDPGVYPEFDAMLQSAMAEELQRVVDDVVFQREGDLRDVLVGSETFVNESLATLYGLGEVPLPGAWESRSLPPDRAGFLTSGAFLTVASQEVRTSPSRRGAFIKRNLLCEPLEGHTPEIPDLLPDVIDASQTTREALEVATADEPCASCHRMFDSFGFALEGFDAIGRARSSEGGAPVDTNGSIDGLGDFAGARDLATRLLDDPNERLSVCLMLNVFRGGLGRLETAGEIAPLTELYDAFRDGDFRLKPLLIAAVDSPSFLFVAEVADE